MDTLKSVLVTAPSCMAGLSVNPTSLTFPRTPVGEQVTRTVTISTGSDIAVDVTATPNGLDPAVFSFERSFVISSTSPKTLDISFQPDQMEVFDGSISFRAGEQETSLRVSGEGIIEVTDIEITGIESALNAAETQPYPSVDLQLGSAEPVALLGTLQLEFEGDNDLPKDPKLVFMDSGGETISFRIPAGSESAEFGSNAAQTAIYQSGTHAGLIRFSVTSLQIEGTSLDQPLPPTRETRVLGSAPVIETPTCTRSGNNLTFQVRGFSTPRQVSGVKFNIESAGAGVISFPGRPGDDFLRGDFEEWYGDLTQSLVHGSTFTFTVPVTVEGSFEALSRATFVVWNEQGDSNNGTPLGVNISACGQ